MILKPDNIKISAIILAAGSSTRFGKSKLNETYKNQSVLSTVISKFKYLKEVNQVNEVLIVKNETLKIDSKISTQKDITIIINPNYRSGLMSSIQKGIETALTDTHAFLFFLADMPAIKTETLIVLLEKYKYLFTMDPKAILAPKFNNQIGNPVIISAKHKQEILNQPFTDCGCKFLFQKYSNHFCTIDVIDESILKDIDTPEQLEDLIKNS